MAARPQKSPAESQSVRSPDIRSFIVMTVVGSVVLWVLIVGLLSGFWVGLGTLQVGTAPPAWFESIGSPTHPGQTGCRNLAGEECYSFLLVSSVRGVHLSGLRFGVLGPPCNDASALNCTPVPLGPSALVSMLNSTGGPVGVWNWTDSRWTEGAGWTIPVNANMTLVLDTGLQNVRLTGDFFYTMMVSPNDGWVSSSL